VTNFSALCRCTLLSANLRNHRKILVVDGEYGFTGGMSIGVRHPLEPRSSRATTGLHFQLKGAVVAL
jgi:cardiolipin synthase